MAFNDTWTGAVSTDWNTAGNWNNGSGPATAPPTSSDTATINPGSGKDTVTGSGALESAELTLSSTGTGSVNLTGSYYTASLNLTGLVQLTGSISDSGTATFAKGAALDGGTTSVQGAATFGSTFTLENAELDLSASSTATLTTLTLIGATTLSGDVTTTALSDSSATSLTLGTGTFDVSGSSTSSPALLPALTIKGDATLEGTFNSTSDPCPSLTVLGGAELYLNAGDSLVAATASFDPSGYVSLTDGALTVTGAASFGSSLTVTGAGSFTVDGTLTTQSGSINASDSSRVEINALNGTSGGLTLTSDGTSTIEIGGQNVGTAGSITIDSGVSFTESGTFSAPVIADNGTITVAPNTSLTLYGNASSRGLTGSGTVDIDKGSSLTLNGVDPGTSDTVTIDFAQTGGQLWLASDDFDALGNFEPAITGFGATDVIEYQGTATSATYASGYLSLYNGANLVAKFNIGSGYAGDTFSTVAISGGYTQVDLAGTPNAAPAGTASADVYQWIGPVAGFWNAKANWDDVTAGQDPATAAPGANDRVSIGAAANGAAQVVIGNGNAYSLSLGGETLLEGQFNVGAGGFSESTYASVVLYSGSALDVSGAAAFGNYAGATLDGGAMAVTGTLNGNYASQFVMENGGSLNAGQLVDYESSYYVYAGDALTVSGGVNDGTAGAGASSFTINGGAFTVGGTFVSTSDSVYAENGGKVQLTSLTEDSHGNGVTLDVDDTTSSIEIGTTGGVAAGTITIDKGTTVTETGSFYASSGTIVDKGVLNVGAGQSLTVEGTLEVDGSATIQANATLTQYGALTGAGTVTIDGGAKLSLTSDSSGTAVTIAFSGAGAELAINSYNDLNASNVFVPTITGFGAADVIDFYDPYATITGAQYAAGQLNLYAGAAIVATLNLSGSYTNAFSVLPVNGGSTYQIDYLGSGTNTAPAGTTSADSYQWVGPVAGFWDAKANWDDVTAVQDPAAVAPGKNDLVTIGAAAGGAAQVVVGNGNADSLTLDGETLLDGVFKIGAGGLTLATSASAYLYGGSSLSVAGNANFANYADATLNGGLLKLTGTGTLNGSYASQFVMENGGSLSAVQLVNYESSYSVLAGDALTVSGGVNDGTAGYGASSFTINGGTFTVGGTFVSTSDDVYAENGGKVQLASLTEDSHGNGVTLDVNDTTSSIEIGTAGGVAAGTITIDSGATITEAGDFIAPTIVDNAPLDIGAGQSLSVNGTLDDFGGVTIGAKGQMTDSSALDLAANMTIGASATLTQNGAITGAGTVTIDAGAKLTMNSDSTGTAVTIAFSGAGGQLAINSYNDLNTSNVFVPAITGFGAADVIDFYDPYATVTGAQYAAGQLNLYAGATIVATLNLSGSYTNAFSVLPVNGGSTYQIDYLGNGTNTAPAGTTSADSYQWVGPVAGFWDAKANWNDVTAGKDPATVAPGKNDLVTIGAAAGGAAQVVVGNGNADSLTLDGETLLDGVFHVYAGGLSLATSASAYLYGGSSLNVAGNAAFANYAGATLNGGVLKLTGTGTLNGSYASQFVIENGGSLSAVQLVNYESSYYVYAGAALTVSGGVNDGTLGYGASTFTINGGTFTVGGTFVSTSDSVYAENGGKVQLASLTEDSDGNGLTLDVYDTTSSIEIGTAGGVAAGTITIDSGATVTEAGAFYASSGTIVDKGVLNVGAGQSLTVEGTLEVDGSATIQAKATLTQYGAMTGAGKVTIDAGSKLSLTSDSTGTAVTVAFSGAGGQLAINSSNDLNASDVFAPTITGFGAADVIDFTDGNATITAAHYAAGELNIYAGATIVATLNLSGTYQDYFSIVPLNGGSTYQIDYEGAAPSSTAPAGTTTSDAYQWVGPVAGFWNAKANWDDTSTGQNPAAAAPGVNDTVTVAAAANGEAQVIDGAGNAYGLTLEGETLLQGKFKVVGTGADGGLTATSSASMVLYAGSSIAVSGDATFSNYAGATLDGGVMTVTGTVYGGYASPFVIENGGSLTAGQLVDYFSSYSVFAGGTVTVDGNVSDSGSGSASSSYTVNGGAFTVEGIFVSTSDSVYAQNGGKVQLAAMQQDVHQNGVTLYVYDSTSSIEIGTAGAAAGGTITIDSGSSVTESGTFYAPTIADNGALTVAAGETLYMDGALGGSGSVSIDAGSTLTVYGASASGTDTIAFAGAGGTLEFGDDPGLPNGMSLTGWASGENLDVRGVTDAAYVSGSLVLYDNGSTVGSFKVGTSYAGDSFDVVPLSNGYSQITIGPSWKNPVSGNFATAADWSTGSVPGTTDSVAISTAGTYTVSVTSSTTVRSIEETASKATVSIGASDVLSLSGVSNINGAIAGTGTLSLTGGVTTLDGKGSMSVGSWQLSGAGTNVTLDQVLNYSENFQAGSGTSVTVSGGNLTLTGQAAFNGATVNGTDTLIAQGTTSVSGLTIAATATFDDAGGLTQNGGTVTVGDAAGNVAELLDASTGTWNITDNSGINLGLSASSSITNNGLFEKTGGTGASAIAPAFDNAFDLLVSSGTLDFKGAVSGTGTDSIQGASTLEFDSTLAAGQTIDFTGTSSGTLDLTDPLGYGGSHIGNFLAGDNVDLSGSWSLLKFSENAGGTLGTLTLTNGTNQVALEFAGDFSQSSFHIQSGATTVIGHT